MVMRPYIHDGKTSIYTPFYAKLDQQHLLRRSRVSSRLPACLHCAMTDTMERPWATFDALPVDLIQRIAAMIPDNTDPVTQRCALCRAPMHSQSCQAVDWQKQFGVCKACIAANITAACSKSS